MMVGDEQEIREQGISLEFVWQNPLTERNEIYRVRFA